MTNYPNERPPQSNPEYTNGYQQQPYPQQYPPPQYPPQQYPPPGYPPQYPVQPQQMAYPYPQQMMMPQPMYAPQANVNVTMGYQQKPQVSMLVRMIYFCLIGWWLGLFCIGVALSLCCSIIGLPLGLMILNRIGAIMTLSTR